MGALRGPTLSVLFMGGLMFGVLLMGVFCGRVLPGGVAAVLFRVLLMGVTKSYVGSADGGLRPI